MNNIRVAMMMAGFLVSGSAVAGVVVPLTSSSAAATAAIPVKSAISGSGTALASAPATATAAIPVKSAISGSGTALASAPATTVSPETAQGNTGGAGNSQKPSMPVESMDGGQGPYALPPLPTPAYIRPGVGMAYQEQAPLSTKEIQWLKSQMAAAQYAMHKGAPLVIENPEIPVDVGPGASVPTIHVQPGYVTTLSILGEGGRPWPITSFTVGGGIQEFGVRALVQSATNGYGSVQSGKKDKQVPSSTNNQVFLGGVPTNIITIAPRFLGSSSNLVITLKGLSTPIMLNLVAGGPDTKDVDGMVTARLNREGPDAPPALMEAPPPSAVSPNLLSFLEQVPPKSAKQLHVVGGYSSSIQVWSWNNELVTRTRVPLVSPAWTSQARQGDVSVYVIPKTNSILVRTDDGVRMVRIED